MEKLTHYVNGEQIEGTSGRYADVYNPATGEVQYQCPLASKSEVDAIIAKAEAAQPAWAAVNPQRRAVVWVVDTPPSTYSRSLYFPSELKSHERIPRS